MQNLFERTKRKREFYLTGPEWVRRIWQTQASFDHFCRSRRNMLASKGALIKLGRDWFVDVQAFPHAVANAYGLTYQCPQSGPENLHTSNNT